jgi:simple sugar transport system ATP-binding protein
MAKEILRMENIVKVYSNGILANNKVNLSVNAGEIHALVGENGAGKSTLMKILYGEDLPDGGEIFFDGKKVSINNTQEAIHLGIGMVHQHFKLIGPMTVAENIVLGKEPQKGLFFDRKKAASQVAELSATYNMEVDPAAAIDSLSVSQKQKVEILKVLMRNTKLIILDEPTAVLTPQETVKLFEQLKKLKQSGYTIIFISHKINEILEICDRITVLRGGKTIITFDTANVKRETLSNAIIGYEMSSTISKPPQKLGKPWLKIEGLNCFAQKKQLLKNITFSVHQGEILGIAGVEGNGQNELVSCLLGRKNATSGVMEVGGQSVKSLTIRQLRDRHISYIPEDRMIFGAVSQFNIEENLISDKYNQQQYSGSIFLKRDNIKKYSDEMVKEFGVLCKSGKQQLGMLSGGNMQKVIAAREFSSDPALLIAEQPTRGIDVGAARIIHEKLLDMRSKGCAIMLISADINEILAISDRIIVMYNGEIAGCFDDVGSLTEQELGLYMLGVKQQHTVEKEQSHA